MDPSLCVNGCGFFGSYENKSLCSKCYKDYILKLNKNINESYSDDQDLKISEAKDEPTTTEIMNKIVERFFSNSDALEYQKKRCRSCNKKTGLTGFMCRCGDSFCGRHRYPEEHLCVVDYKEIGRQLLRKQNPLCRAAKLDEKI